MPSNTAAWITEGKANPLTVKEAPYTSPGPDEVVIKNAALAINPVDWKIQDYDFFIEKYPTILGCDVAGEIVEVGQNVTNLQVGQRVLGHALSLMTQQPQHGGFQAYTITPAGLTAPIPANISYASASVLPLALSTASAGLFQQTHLGLVHPSLSPVKQDSTLLVWGGSSSVGSTAIQLAKGAGYNVIATASTRNHAYCKELGADAVFDHSSSSVVDDIISFLKGKHLVGIYDAISEETTIKACITIAEAADSTRPDNTKSIASVLPGTDAHSTSSVKVLPVFAPTILSNSTAPAVWGQYVPAALEAGLLLAKPEPLVVGQGLEKVQEGMNKSRSGVSAAKVVVTL